MVYGYKMHVRFGLKDKEQSVKLDMHLPISCSNGGSLPDLEIPDHLGNTDKEGLWLRSRDSPGIARDTLTIWVTLTRWSLSWIL